MLKSVFSRVSGGGKAVVLVVVALTVLTSGTAVAKPKLVKATLEYVSNTGLAGAVMKLTNNQGGSALDLVVNPDVAPLTVNPEAGTATNLDADRLDGKDSSEFALKAAEDWHEVGAAGEPEFILSG